MKLVPQLKHDGQVIGYETEPYLPITATVREHGVSIGFCQYFFESGFLRGKPSEDEIKDVMRQLCLSAAAMMRGEADCIEEDLEKSQ